MATYWVDPVTGSDADDGLTQPNAKATLQGGLGLLTSAGDILNIVNSGPLQVTQTTNMTAGTAGTSFTNFGAKIQGVTAAGAPALATLKFDNNSTARSAIGVRSGNSYIIIQGLKIDRSVNTVASTQKNLCVVFDNSGTNTAGPVRIQYCVSINKTGTTITGNTITTTASAPDATTSIEIRYCLFTDGGTDAFINVTNEPGRTVSFNHNVIIFENSATVGTNINFGAVDSIATTDHEFIYNTILIRAGRVSILSSAATSASAAAQKKFHSNVFAQYSATAGTDQMFSGSATWEDTPWSGTRTIGFNLFVDGVDAGAFKWAADQPYKVPWDFDNSDVPSDTGQLWSTDVSDTADPFNAKSTSWDWANINGDGYTITLTGDLRLVLHRTVGQGSTVPGAIIDAVAVAVNDSYSFVNNVVTTIPAPGVLGNDTGVGGGTAVMVVNIPTAAGTLFLNPDGSFTYTPESTFQGTTSFTYKIDTGGGSFSNTATVTMFVSSPAPILPPAEPGPPISPTTPGFLFPEPNGISTKLHLIKNTVREVRQKTDGVQQQISHLDMGVAVIGTNTSAAVFIQPSTKIYIVETDAKVTLRLNSQTFLLMAGGCALIGGASLVTFRGINASTVQQATLRYFGAK